MTNKNPVEKKNKQKQKQELLLITTQGFNYFSQYHKQKQKIVLKLCMGN